MAHVITYYTIQAHIDSGYCTELVEKCKTVNDAIDRNMILLSLIDFAIFEQSRRSLCICDTLLLEKSHEHVVNLCVLIGNIGISDKYRPTLFDNNLASNIVSALEYVDDIDDKMKIVDSIIRLCQTKSNVLQFIHAGIIPELCNLLKIVHTDTQKKHVSFCIFWVSYLTYNKTMAVEYGCVELMYNALKSMSNKPKQSHILTDMNYFLKDESIDNRYPICVMAN